MTLRRAPDFWWRRHSLTGYALAPLGALYGRASARRMAEPGISVGIPIICIGNFVVGGAGKTPTAIEVASVCRGLGIKPGFLSRGYMASTRGPILVSTAAHTAREVGDEPLLLALHAPTVVSADRVSGARLLASLGVDAIVMDDGFQNPSLVKDLSLVLLDGTRGTGNGRVFPAGPLRAPLSGQIRRTDAIVVMGEGPGGEVVRAAARAGLPILRAQLEPLRRHGLEQHPYLAFAGIADPKKFYASLAASGADIGYTMDFPDHHWFSGVECERIMAHAKRRQLVPITTEKDRVRLLGRDGAVERLAQAAETFPVRARFAEPQRLAALIADAVAGYSDAYRRRVIPTGAETVPA